MAGLRHRLCFEYWGKARPAEGEADCHLLPLHSLDVAAVGDVYLRLNPPLLAWLAAELGCADDLPRVRAWLVFWLALHDLGKFSLSFQAQRLDVMERLQHEPAPHRGLPDVRHDSLGHQLWIEDLLPEVLADAWFDGDDGALEEGLGWWVRAVTGHHGQPPREDVPLMSRHFRPRDREAARAFAREMRVLLLPDAAAALPRALGARFAPLSQALSWWVAGLAVLADWIGSNAEVFRYQDQAPDTLDAYWTLARQRAEQALQRSGVLPVARQSALSFEQLFPAIRHPSPLQDWAARVPLLPGPQLHLLEDVTGAGKTEAALMLAHRLMADGHAEGFFIGLPTMATANAMYQRLAAFYARLFAGHASLVLAHGGSRLVEEFAASIVESGPDEGDAAQGDDSATRRCQRWLADYNKRALLSPAGIGTVDQVLLGALQSKHQSLRLLGLARKVLVVDEVHACDPYMQQTLETLLRLHAQAGGSAILLSATLSGGMKASLMRAFAQGRGFEDAPALRKADYPLASHWSAVRPECVDEHALPTRPEVRRELAVRYLCDRREVIAGIVAALRQGQCVAWIRNTVGDALQAHAEMAGQWPAERITLFHARFALGDRLDIEAEVLAQFGAQSGPGRHQGRLLIATQVAEQSLDVDFDLVVSDLAPIDRLIQRAGRLQRHVRDAQGHRLPAGAADGRGPPVLWVLGPPWTADPDPRWLRQACPRSAQVYPNHAQLWLSARALQPGRLRMPDDARTLIESVFGDAANAQVPAGLQRSADEALNKAYADKSQAQLNSIKPAEGYIRWCLAWADDTVAPSRLGEDTVELLLGRWEGDQLQPWRADRGREAWAYSTLRVARRLIAEVEPPSSEPRALAYAKAMEEVAALRKGALLLVLDKADGSYQAAARGLSGREAPRRVTWSYSPIDGLFPLKAPEGGASGGPSPPR